MKRIYSLILIISIASPALAEVPKSEEIEWIKRHAVPMKTCEAGHGFEDLQPLKALIGNARIVSLGECTHGTREVFQMKHRLVEFLAAHMGFTIFSIEANMPEAYRVNEFVREGKGDVEELIAGMYFWTWNTHEVKEMILWMREFNQSGAGRIEFTGFDMQTPDVAMSIVQDHLKKVDVEQSNRVSQVYKLCKTVDSAGGGNSNFGVATATFPLHAAKGKKVRYSGWIRTENIRRDFAGLWWRIDGKNGSLGFDNMQDRGIKGTADWKEYAIELNVPADATNINFGAILPGDGKAWFDGLHVEIDGRRFETGPSLDLDFEGDSPVGFYTGGNGYSVTLDESVCKTGKKSLRMEFTGAQAAAPNIPTMEPADAAKQCGKIVLDMLAAREGYAKATSPKEADWAIQNARIVHQAYQMRAEGVQRDESMARNVKWILDNAPAETKIVLWAHNGHVSKGRMGPHGAMGFYLNEWYGKDQIVIGFSAGEGEYTAMVPKKGLFSNNPLNPPPPGSIEDSFRRSGIPIFLLDLRKVSRSDPGSTWLTGQVLMRSIGALATDEQFWPQDVAQDYDAIVYIDKTTASRLLPRSGGRRK